MKAILTVIGQDKVGIIAGVSAKMLEFNINILDVNQTIMQDFFTMMMMLDCSNMKGNFDDVRAALTEEGKKLGVDIDNLIVSQPDTGEQALEIAEALVRSGAIDIIVVDSVAALVPKAEIDGEMGDSHIGLQARLMSQALRKLAGIVSKSRTTAVFINQLREKVGIMFGNPEVTPGGRALKFYSSVRLDVRRIESLKQGNEVVGNRTRVKVVKNKIAPPFKEAEFDIVYGEGISREGNILDIAVNMEIVNKSGAWFSYNGQRIGQGRENSKQYLKENSALCVEIEKLVRSNIAPAVVQPATTENVKEKDIKAEDDE